MTRLGEQLFRVVTGAGVVESDMGWLRLHMRDEDGPVEMREVTERLSVIGIWGPRARDVVAACSDDDVSAAAFPFRTAREIRIGEPVLAQRITYVGELGFELYAEAPDAVQVWDRLAAAGREHGLAIAGYRALEGLRLEKGYRYMGSDLTGGDTPYEAGLGFCVALDKGEFIGGEALRRGRDGAVAPDPHAAGGRRGLPAGIRRRGGAGERGDGRPRAERCATGTPWGGRSRSPTCRPTSPTTPGSRSRCWAGRSRPSWQPTCWSTPSTPASAHDTAVTGA